MVSSLVQLKSILWKNWLLKKAHFSGFLAEILLPVLFMMLLIMIKSLTSVYDSPNVAYHCGNTYPWFYTGVLDYDQIAAGESPIKCLEKPDTCTVQNYYKDSETFTYENKAVTLSSQYGYIQSSASSGQGASPFYAYTIADKSAFYYIWVDGFYVDNPSLSLCSILMRLYSAPDRAILVVAPQVSDNPQLTAYSHSLWRFIIDECLAETGIDYSEVVRLFESQSSMEDYCTDKDYEDQDYGNGKVAFAIILNAVDKDAVQWDYSIRANYTSFFDQDDPTVACLYGSCDFTYTVPSTKFYTQDLFKPQSAEFLYGYTYSGFATLQQIVDQYIFSVYATPDFGPARRLDGATADAAAASTSPAPAPADASPERDAPSPRQASLQEKAKVGSGDASDHSFVGVPRNVVKIMASVGLMPTAAYKTDDFQYVISSTLGIFYMLSFLYPVSRIIRALVLEKETRIKEGMKMMGLTDSVYNLSWLITTVLQMTFVSALITLVTASSVFEYSNKFFVFLYFEAFSLAVINMCFLLSTFFSRSKSASLLGPMIFFASFFPYYAVNDDQYDASAKAATCVLAPACFALGAEVFADYEGGLVGVQASNVNLETSNFTYNLCVGMLFFDAALYGVLAWYLDNVLPSEFGTQLPLYFPLLPSYWCGSSASFTSSSKQPGLLAELTTCFGLLGPARRYSRVSSGEGAGEEGALHAGLMEGAEAGEGQQLAANKRGEYIEAVSADLHRQAASKTCLSICALRKVFKSAAGGSDRVAVDKLDLNLYQGQVTVLLGHNGAGKTTTISMLVGLLPPTAGTAYFPGGLSIVHDMHEIRRNLGVCPQHDILFPELTVMEHLQIYASFKGVPGAQVAAAAKAMLAEVGLSEKANARSSTLSGGQKRKLSLGIALIGDSKVVILDEPTSGMDPYSRRSTWNIIQRNKKGRIILLTTHFMDEADLLGDRVAIMAHGKLQCCGSPLFLKNKFGVGYTLTVVKEQPRPSAAAVTAGATHTVDGLSVAAANSAERSRLLRELVQSYIEEAEPLSDVGAEQSFRLPFSASGRFVELFSAFEAEKEALGIAEYGISVTTLEEVFIRVGEMEESINEVSEAEAEARAIAEEEAAERAKLLSQSAAGSEGAGGATVSPLSMGSSEASASVGAGAAAAAVVPHGILHHSHDHHHQRGRARSTSSEQLHLRSPRSSTTSVDHHHGHGPHKRVSFREGEGEERPSLSGLTGVVAHPAPEKVEVELRVDKVVAAGEDHRRHSHESSSHTHIGGLSPEEKLASASGVPHTKGLFCTHFTALLTKRAIYAKRDRRMIFCQLVLPVLLVVLGVTLLLIKPNLNQPNMILSASKFNEDMDSAYRNFVPFSIDNSPEGSFPYHLQLRFNGNEDDGVYGKAVPIQDLGGGDSFDTCALGPTALYNMSEYVLQSVDDPSVDAEQGSTRYGAITIAADTNATNLNYNILVNGSAIHGVGVYVNLVHQAFLQLVSDTPTAQIVARNYPLPETYKQKNDAATADAFVVALFAMIAFCFIPASFAVFVVKEREVKAKHQQVISGVSIYAYWTSTYLWDILSYLPTAALVIVVVYVYDVSAFVKGSSAAGFALLLLMYGPATAAITYLLSFIFVSHSTAQIVVMFFNFITGLCLVVVSFVLTTIPSTTEISLSLRYLFRLFPSFCMGDGIIQLALCTDGTSCPVIDKNGYNFDSTQSPMAWDIVGADLVFLGWQAVVYFAIAVLIEYGLTFPALLAWLYDVEDEEADVHERLLAGNSSGTEVEDEDVQAERQRVMSGAADGEVVRIQQLRKIYPVNSKAGGVDPLAMFRFAWRKLSKAVRSLVGGQRGAEAEWARRNQQRSGAGQKRYKVAVQSLCFGIPKGQCFGFLGINGAGKTTTLSILSGEFPPTSGEAYIDGFSIRDDQSNIRRRIGYCPQFDALLELLTVREHLELYGRIKGFVGAGLEAIVRGKLVQLDLKDFEHKTAGSLSGGNKRKLSVAVATIGEPSIIFLDEPSTGMDPVARRFMWKVIARMTAEDAQCSVILTTHSMEEAEALCSRIGVMVNGRLRCLGPAQHLKLRFGNGFEVNIKLQSPTASALTALQQTAMGPLRATDRRRSASRSSTEGHRLSFSGNLLASVFPSSTGAADPPASSAVTSPLEDLVMAESGQLRNSLALPDLDDLRIRRDQLVPVCEALGKPHRAQQIAPFQSGALLHEALEAEGGEIALRMFLEWWLLEDAAQQLHTFMLTEFGARAQLLERSTAQSFRYRVQLSEQPAGGAAEGEGQQGSDGSTHMQGALSDLFSKFEAHKAQLGVLEYSVGQTTLEQIFNQFASQQDNPEVQAARDAAEAAATAGKR